MKLFNLSIYCMLCFFFFYELHNICISELLLKLKWRRLKADQSLVTEPPHLPDPHLVCTLS